MTNLYELKMGAEKLEALKVLLENLKELEAAISQININEIKDANTLTNALLAEAKNVLEAIKPMEQKAQAALDTIANSQAKFAELDALKSNLEDLKTSLEALVFTGVIDDTKVSATQTYSSKKVEDLVKTKTDTLTADMKTKTDALENIITNQWQSIETLDNKINTTQRSLNSFEQESNNVFAKKQEIINPNLLMNGSFCSTERLSPDLTLTGVGSGGYLIDKWRYFDSNGSSRADVSLEYSDKNRLKITKTAGDSGSIFTQDIENFNQFNKDDYLTVSFYIEKQAVANCTVNLHFYDGEKWSIVFYRELNCELNKENFLTCTDKVNRNIVPAPNRKIQETFFRFQIVFNETGVENNGKVVYLSNIKLEKGTIATKYVPYGGSEEADRRACLRYFERIRRRLHFSPFIKTDSLEYFLDVLYKVQKRTDSPTINFDVVDGLQKGDVPNGIYVVNGGLLSLNRDGVLFGTKIKNAPAYIENITIDADF